MAKTFCSKFEIKLKLADFISLSTTGSLIGIHGTPPKESVGNLVSPQTGEGLKQFYIPISKLFGDTVNVEDLLTRDQCDIAVKIKDNEKGEVNQTSLPKEAVQKLHESNLPKNIMNLTVHTRGDADSVMFPVKNGQSYVFYPSSEDPDNLQNYQLLVEVVKRGELAFCSIVNLQNYEGLYRLDVWRERLVLVKQTFPESLVDHSFPGEGEFGVGLPANVVVKAANAFKKMAEPINVETYKDRITAGKIALKHEVDEGVEPKIVNKKNASNLEALLEALGE